MLLLLLQKVLLFLPEHPERIELLYCLLRYVRLWLHRQHRLFQNRKHWLQSCSLHHSFLSLIPYKNSAAA